MRRLIMDLDGTLTHDEPVPYPERRPRPEVIARLREYKALGFTVVIHSSRNMRTHGGNVGLINVHTLPGILDWLRRHAVPFDEVVVGKPWCGHEGFYVDDRALRPDEFARLSPEAAAALLARTGAGTGG